MNTFTGGEGAAFGDSGGTGGKTGGGGGGAGSFSGSFGGGGGKGIWANEIPSMPPITSMPVNTTPLAETDRTLETIQPALLPAHVNDDSCCLSRFAARTTAE